MSSVDQEHTRRSWRYSSTHLPSMCKTLSSIPSPPTPREKKTTRNSCTSQNFKFKPRKWPSISDIVLKCKDMTMYPHNPKAVLSPLHVLVGYQLLSRPLCHVVLPLLFYPRSRIYVPTSGVGVELMTCLC